jgi:hypothetical protein
VVFTYRQAMPSDRRPPPQYVSEAGKGSRIDAKTVRSALAHWRRLEQTGSPTLRRAAARQAQLCEAMLAVVENEPL